MSKFCHTHNIGPKVKIVTEKCVLTSSLRALSSGKPEIALNALLKRRTGESKSNCVVFYKEKHACLC
jgi:hypothetical protein